MAKEITFEITEHIADLSETSSKGWTKELNIVKWSSGEGKYDIREWNEDHTRMSKGITLTADELAKLKEAIASVK